MNKVPIEKDKDKYDLRVPLVNQDVREDIPGWRNICGEFGKGPGEVGYDSGDRNCLVCHLSLVCMSVQRMALEGNIEVLRAEHYDGNPFYDENEIKENGKELVQTYINTIQDKTKEGDVITTKRLRVALRRDVLEVLNSMDYELVDVLLEAIERSPKIKRENDNWVYDESK